MQLINKFVVVILSLWSHWTIWNIGL